MNKGWIFDCIDLLDSEKFKDFFIKLMQDKNIHKVGHTFNGDIRVFCYTFNCKLPGVNNLTNFEKFFGRKSLGHITEIVLNKYLCKFEQISSWQKRPLRKSQIHYGILDSVISLYLYQNRFKYMNKN